MKKLLIILIILFTSCNINPEYNLEYGKIISTEIYKKYNSTMHIYNDVYMTGIQFKDTVIYMILGQKYNIGDSIQMHIYRFRNKINDVKMDNKIFRQP